MMNKSNLSMVPQHFQKRIIKSNEFKFYDYGSQVNLPNQQVVRDHVNDDSLANHEVANKAHVRKYQLDVTSSIDCLPGMFYKSP